MKAVRLLFVLLLLAGGARLCVSRAEGGRYGRSDLNGKVYLRLNDWAKANHFDIHWLKTGDVVQVSRASNSMIFNRDSRECEIGGIHVCLSYPILIRNGTPYVSQVDLDTTINPILSPPQDLRGKNIRNIVIDPGHGGKDSGEHAGSQQEKTYVLLIAKELRDQLNKAGFNASLTRTTDTFIELPDRPLIAARRNADLFVSIHLNSLPGKSDIKGCQIFCMTPAGASSSNAGGEIVNAGPARGNRNNDRNIFLAYSLQRALLKNVGMEDRGVRRARFMVLCNAEMPAVLIEGGFMSNPSEARRIYDSSYRRQLAGAIVKGIVAYKHQVEQ